MIPRLSPNYNIQECLSTMLPASSNNVVKLEYAFCLRTQHQNAIAFRYGRSGLYYLLKALGDGTGKYVVIPAYSCVVVAHAVVEAGYTPIFLDNEVDKLQPSNQAYFDILKEHGPQIAMIVPTHLFGITEDAQELYEYTKQHYPDIFVLQDCAHGFFCKDDNGTTAAHYGDGALFGMNISKLANSVKGGMITIIDDKIAAKVRELHNADLQGGTSKPNMVLQSVIARIYTLAAYFAFKPLFYDLLHWLQKNTKLLSSQTDYYNEDEITLPQDYKGAMCGFEANIGLKSLEKYNQRIAYRQHIAQRYSDLLEAYSNLTPPEYHPGYSWSHYPVLCANIDLKRHIIKALAKSGFEIGEIVDYSIPDMACYKALKYPSCPNALKHAELVINLPLTLAENLDLNIVKTMEARLSKFEKAFSKAMDDFKQP
ncbi:MAG TPA: DegT/DnrJ/EryC1/StrS aminotransferase family protein [Micavibrio sp.]|nr:DegT/DnrJ/EryC1/StrS aminotransferase family protein [Micavibrio sp.]HIL28538.1 DegT/DnrJ/EryC1/StrS aminotransferase family protein [Micavibrio sp.]